MNQHEEQAIIQKALSILEDRMTYTQQFITSPQEAKTYLRLKLGFYDHEVFGAIYLTNKNEVIAFRELSHGTIGEAVTYPREFFKTAFELKAAAAILAHNHPSGNPTPSDDDIALTQHFIDLGRELNVRILDHIIVGRDSAYSFARESHI